MESLKTQLAAAQAAAAEGASAPDYAGMNVNDLKGLLTKRGLNPFGPKADLVQRLVQADAGVEASPAKASPLKPAAKKRKRT